MNKNTISIILFFILSSIIWNCQLINRNDKMPIGASVLGRMRFGNSGKLHYGRGQFNEKCALYWDPLITQIGNVTVSVYLPNDSLIARANTQVICNKLGVYPYHNVIEHNEIKGIKIQNVHSHSPASKIGIQSGDIITKIGRSKIQSFLQFLKLMHEMPEGENIEIEFYREGNFLKETVFVDYTPKSAYCFIEIPDAPLQRKSTNEFIVKINESVQNPFVKKEDYSFELLWRYTEPGKGFWRVPFREDFWCHTKRNQEYGVGISFYAEFELTPKGDSLFTSIVLNQMNAIIDSTEDHLVQSRIRKARNALYSFATISKEFHNQCSPKEAPWFEEIERKVSTLWLKLGDSEDSLHLKMQAYKRSIVLDAKNESARKKLEACKKELTNKIFPVVIKIREAWKEIEKMRLELKQLCLKEIEQDKRIPEAGKKSEEISRYLSEIYSPLMKQFADYLRLYSEIFGGWELKKFIDKYGLNDIATF